MSEGHRNAASWIMPTVTFAGQLGGPDGGIRIRLMAKLNALRQFVCSM